MKVVLLSFSFPEYCVQLANALACNADVLLMLPKRSPPIRMAALSPAVRLDLFHHPRLRQPLRQMRMVAELLRTIQRFDPDIVHIQQGHMWLNFAFPWLRRYPLVLTIHDPRYHLGDKESQKTPQWVMDFGFRSATQVIAHGARMKDVIVEQLRIPQSIITVIPPVPDILVENPDAVAHVQEEDSMILFFGRIWEYKGLQYLIQAEPLITLHVPDVRIVIAGQGEDFDRYRRMMVHPERFVVHNEYVSNDKRDLLFRQASVVVLPYVDASLSGVIPVAYTFARPVVATSVGVLPEMVEHGHTGYIVPPRDERALASALVGLLQQRQLRRQLGANGRRKLETTFSPQAVAGQTIAVYQRAIDSRQATRRL